MAPSKGGPTFSCNDDLLRNWRNAAPDPQTSRLKSYKAAALLIRIEVRVLFLKNHGRSLMHTSACFIGAWKVFEAVFHLL